MKYAKFGRTGLTVSRLCMGTAVFGSQTSEEDSIAILDAAAEAGVNFVDTSNAYPMNVPMPELGRSEEILGRWLKSKRSQFFVTTKAGAPVGTSSWDTGTSRKHLLESIDASLRRLNTDYIDLLQLHFDDPETPIDETVEALDAIVRAGKAHYIGVSNFLAYRLARAIGRQEALRLAKYVSIQPRYNLLFRQIERELLPLAQEENLAVMPFNPLAGGLLTGKYKLDAEPGEGRFSTVASGTFGAAYQQRYWHDREFTTVTRLSQVAKQRGIALPTLAIAWVLANPVVTSAILGASRVAQLDATLAAVDLEIDEELKTELDEITLEYRHGDASR
jgi:aryl-alcohol dehydrogenase-like predicted oxidoreductase